MKPNKKHIFKLKTTAKTWDEGLALGNGKIGSLIWGESNKFNISLDRVDIWETQLHPNISKENHNYNYLKKLVEDHKQEDIISLFESPYLYASPTKLPVGRIEFNFNNSNKIKSQLNIKKAQASVKIKGDKDFEFLSYLHAINKIGYIKIKDKDFSYKIRNPQFDTNDYEINFNEEVDSVNTASISKLSYKKPIKKEDGNFRYFIQPLKGNKKFGIFTLEKRYSNYSEIVFSVYTQEDCEDIISYAKNQLEKAIDIGYDNNFKSHTKWWKNYWKESSIDLKDKELEKAWYFNNYLLASASRKNCPPMPLQALWTADNDKLPPWKGDYHHDLNTQFSYMGYLKANHIEQGESFFDYLISLEEKSSEFAKTFYRAKGICLPSIMDYLGNPIGGWTMYAYSPTSQAWLADLFYRHAKFTGDKLFSKNKAYPYIKKSVSFILSILEYRNGELTLPLSASPEIHDNTYNAWFKDNTNYDISLIRKLLLDIIDLEDNENDIKYYKEILKKLPNLEVDPKIGLLISKNIALEESHRHFSHLLSIYPLRLLDYENDKIIIDNSISYLEKLGTGMWVSFSFVWMSLLYSVQHNGEAASFQLKLFLKHFCSINNFNINGDNKNLGICCWKYRPFTIETNMLVCEAIEEMLLYSEKGEIELFPALNKKCKKSSSFKNLLAWNGILISSKIENNTITKLKFKNAENKQLIIKKFSSIEHLIDSINCRVEKLDNDKALLSFYDNKK